MACIVNVLKLITLGEAQRNQHNLIFLLQKKYVKYNCFNSMFAEANSSVFNI